MTGIYLLSVIQEFSAAHEVRGHPGKCARMHGHNWKVEAEVAATQLNDIGIALDFYEIRIALSKLVDTLDHQNLNAIAPFDSINPTAENLAAWFYKQLSLEIKSNTYKLQAIKIWETERCSVRYSEND
jgi:queuosine biosynthesis protein QueD